MVDASSCFGKHYKSKSIWKGGVKHPVLKDTLIWFPKLYDNNNWTNEIDDDESHHMVDTYDNKRK